MCVPVQRRSARRCGLLSLKCAPAAILAAAVLPAQAGTVSVTANVQNVRAGNDRVTMTTVEAPINPAGCSSTSYYEMQNDASKNPKLAILLAAQAAAREVVLEVDDSVCGLYGRPVVVFVTIRK